LQQEPRQYLDIAGVRAPRKRQTLPQDGTRAPGLLSARIHAIMPTLLTAYPPWPRGKGGRPALRTAPSSPRAKTGNARSPQIKSVLRCTRVGELWNDRHCLTPELEYPNYYYPESQLYNLAAQSIGSMGALITSIMNPGNHAASCPIGHRALGRNNRNDPEAALRLHDCYYDKSEAEK